MFSIFFLFNCRFFSSLSYEFFVKYVFYTHFVFLLQSMDDPYTLISSYTGQFLSYNSLNVFKNESYALFTSHIQ